MNGEVEKKRMSRSSTLAISTSSTLTMVPLHISATTGMAGDATWSSILETVISIADWLCVGVIIFAGIRWMFGDRTKAMELLIGSASGYLLIRHARDIQLWLAGI